MRAHTGRVLLVEDGESDSSVVEQTLRAIHPLLSVTTRHDPWAALDTLLDVQPNLVLLDVQMPRMTGLECLKHVKADAVTARIAVIVLTQYNDDANVWNAYQVHANALW